MVSTANPILLIPPHHHHQQQSHLQINLRKEKKDNELKELRRKLAELEKQKTEQITPPPTAVETNDNEESKEDKTE